MYIHCFRLFLFSIFHIFFPHSYPPYDEKLPDRKKNPKIYLISHFFFSPLLLYVWQKKMRQDSMVRNYIIIPYWTLDTIIPSFVGGQVGVCCATKNVKLNQKDKFIYYSNYSNIHLFLNVVVLNFEPNVSSASRQQRIRYCYCVFFIVSTCSRLT